MQSQVNRLASFDSPDEASGATWGLAGVVRWEQCGHSHADEGARATRGMLHTHLLDVDGQDLGAGDHVVQGTSGGFVY